MISLTPVLVLLISSFHAGQCTELNPITRVVKLLEDLSKRAEVDQEKEGDLWDKFACWAKTSIAAKKTSNSDAEARIATLTTFIDDVESGRIEFTSEKGDLTKQLKAENDDIKSTEDLRARDKGEFEDAEDEMEDAIQALGDAIGVLAEATNPKLFLMERRVQAQEGYAERMKEAAHLQRAVTLGEQVLSKGDALFLQRLLTDTTVTPHGGDHKKLNRKATFKKSYKARSTGIQGTLGEMKATFEENLKAARDKEAKDQASYEKLLDTKKQQRDQTEAALGDMKAETEAASSNREDAKTEKESLEKQIETDNKFIKQIEDAFADKEEEFHERQNLRAGEIAAYKEAIKILYSDDARDLAAKSFGSQGYLLLQKKSTKEMAALKVLRRVAASSHDPKFLELVAEANSMQRLDKKFPGLFKSIVKKIDSLLAQIEQERDEDMAEKEQCESDRAGYTSRARENAIAVDDKTDAIRIEEAKIKELEGKIDAANASIAQLQKELAQATVQRQNELYEFGNSTADDKAMIKVVEKATAVLTDFYKENDMEMLQKQTKPKTAAAGDAPLPPPNTWGSGERYEGNTESKGVIAQLEIIKQDVESDIAKAKEQEEKAVAEFGEYTTETQDAIAEQNQDITDFTEQKSGRQESRARLMGERRTHRTELATEEDSLGQIWKRCEWLILALPEREASRQHETHDLLEAKTAMTSGLKV